MSPRSRGDVSVRCGRSSSKVLEGADVDFACRRIRGFSPESIVLKQAVKQGAQIYLCYTRDSRVTRESCSDCKNTSS